jgi:hypothetical protein
MREIESYSFGKMVYDGRVYTADLIIFPGRVFSNWWRLAGHHLHMEDLVEVLAEKPDVLVIGTGKMGVMQVPGALREELKQKGIELVVEKTGEAVRVFNSADRTKKVVGAFHLTC